MEELIFKMQGSGKNIYTVSIVRDDDGIFMNCNCPAGRFNDGSLCKHRLAILSGDDSKLINVDHQQFDRIKEIINDFNKDGVLDKYIELSSYVLAYNRAIKVIQDVECSEVQDIKLLQIDEYERLINDGMFSLPIKKSGVAENVFDIDGIYHGSLKTRRGLSDINNRVSFECRSKKYEKEKVEAYVDESGRFREIKTGEMIMGWHMISVSISLNNPIYKGVYARNQIEFEIDKLTNLLLI